MSLTPAQKRRKHFRRPEDWALWAVRVLRGNRGVVSLNLYSWKTSTNDLLRGMKEAIKQGWVVCEDWSDHSAVTYRLQKDKAPRSNQ